MFLMIPSLLGVEHYLDKQSKETKLK